MGRQDREKGSILEAVALAGWLSSPQTQPAVLDLLDATWDEIEYDGMLVSGGSTQQNAWQQYVYRTLRRITHGTDPLARF